MDTTDNQAELNNTNETAPEAVTPPPAEPAPEAAPQPEAVAPAPQPAPVPQKKKGVPVALIIVLAIVAVIGFLIIGGIMAVFDGLGGNDAAKAKQYLENKYGKSEGFSDGVFSDGTSIGDHEYEFTSSKSSTRFVVHINYDRKFSDNYYLVQFENDFKDYYYNKYGKAQVKNLPYDFTVRYTDFEYGDSYGFPFLSTDEKYTSFNDLLKFIEENRTHDETISYVVDYKEIGLDKLETIDLSTIRLKMDDTIRDIIAEERYSQGYYDRDDFSDEGRKLKKYFYLDIMMEGSGRTGLCPDNMKATTVRQNSTNYDDPEEIWFCRIEIYNS